MSKKSQSSKPQPAASADAAPSAAEPHAVDEIIELNNKFAKAILEASESYLRAMSSAQEHLWSPLRLSQSLLDSASSEALSLATETFVDEDKEAPGASAFGPDDRVTSLKPEPPDNLVRLHSGENPLTKKTRIQRAWAQRVSSQYMAEAQRLLDIAQKAEHGQWSPAMVPTADSDGAEESERNRSASAQNTQKG